MICKNYKDAKLVDMGNGIAVRWLTHKDMGGEEYVHNHALRMATIAPGTETDMHGHKFVQIIYVLSGKLIFSVKDKDGNRTDREMGPGDFVYTYSDEIHGMANRGTEPAVVLDCIDCVDGKGNCTQS